MKYTQKNIFTSYFEKKIANFIIGQKSAMLLTSGRYS